MCCPRARLGAVPLNCSIEGEFEACGGQSAGAGREAQPWGARLAQRRLLAVHGEDQATPDLLELPAQHLSAAEATLLDGRDLRLVKDVADVDAVLRDRDRGEVVDAEVPERVGLSGRRAQRCENSSNEGQHHHSVALTVEIQRKPGESHRTAPGISAAAAGDKAARPLIAISKCRAASRARPTSRAATPACSRKTGSRDPVLKARRAQTYPARAWPARVRAHPSASAERMLGAACHTRSPSRTDRFGEPWFASKSTASASGRVPFLPSNACCTRAAARSARAARR